MKETENDSLFRKANPMTIAYYNQIKGLYLVSIGKASQGSAFLMISNKKFQDQYTLRTRELHDIYKLAKTIKRYS